MIIRNPQTTSTSLRTTLPTIFVTIVFLLAGCTSTEPERADEPTTGFDDHTVDRIEDEAAFEQLAKADGRQATVKFTIPNIVDDDDVYWMDSNFYELHDEWFWFRLFNGEPAPNIDVEPFDAGQSFETIDEIYDWAEDKDDSELPLDLERFEDRIYSDRFYEEAIHVEPRNYGVGSLIRFETDEDTRWLFELEYTDLPTEDEIELFFERISSVVGEEIGDELAWVVRSPEQETLAQQIEQSNSEYNDRIVRYSELVPVGEVDVYNDGLTAGRIRIIGDDETSLSETTDRDIVIVESVPDWLPPAAAIISSDPQTPLAHVNLLARNRGIPNASMAGIIDNPGLLRAARTGAPAIVDASNDELQITLISEDEYREWNGGPTDEALSVTPVDLTATETVVDLTTVSTQVSSEADIDALRPTIGGKSAGFLTLLEADESAAPLDPLAITVRPYFEHLDTIDDQLQTMLDNSTFQESPQVRFLLLEGPEDYAETFTSAADADVAESFMADHPTGTPLGDIIEVGGFKSVFRNVPMDPTTLTTITDALENQYGDYSATQGIRFRSSSTVEDLEGFSGAGLYDSNTGFLQPGIQEDEDDQEKSVEFSIKKTWASYWGFEAYEERERENIDHQSGGMGVLVHARFDDELEQNNGVAAFTLLPESDDDRAVAVINIQTGDVSVTNPDLEDVELPEIVEVRQADDGSLSIDRLAESTLTDGSDVLDDDALFELFDRLDASATLWLERTNVDLVPRQQLESVTLDFEFKTMAPGWPAYSDDQPEEPGRLVLKQVRSLDPGLRGTPTELLEAPIPRDVLAYAQSVERFECQSDTSVTNTYYAVYTPARIQPDFGFDVDPLIVAGAETSPTVAGLGGLEDCGKLTLIADPDEQLTAILTDPDRPSLVDSTS